MSDLSNLPRHKRDKLTMRRINKLVKYMYGTRKRYIRKGKCVRCCKCCETEDCEHFRPGSPSSCVIHKDSNRPEKCRLYQANPPLTYDTCGYWFWDVVEKKKVFSGRDL